MKKMRRNQSKRISQARDINNQTRTNRPLSSFQANPTSTNRRPTETIQSHNLKNKSSSLTNFNTNHSKQIIEKIQNLTTEEKNLRQKKTKQRIEHMRAVRALERQGAVVNPRNIDNMVAYLKQATKTRNLTDSDVQSYISQSAKVKEGEGIVSGKLKAIGMIIFLFLIILLLIGNFLNENNPLVPLFKSIKENFIITILDNKGATILEARKNNEDVLDSSEINQNIIYSFTALHTLLELIDMEKKKQKLDTIDIDKAFIQKMIQQYQLLLIKQQIPKLPDSKQGLLNFTFNLVSSPLGKNKTECQIFTSPNSMNNSDCQYSYVNFILHKLYKPKSSTFFDLLSQPFKDYLLTNWLKNSVSLNKFLYVFLNITYYGNYQLGFKNSFISYFEGKQIDNIDLPEAIFLIQMLYENNKAYYPSYPITQQDLIKMLYAVRYIPNKILPIKTKNEKSKKYIDYVNEQVVALDKEIQYKHNNPFGLYIDNIFFKGFFNFPEQLLVKIQTTFSIKLQNIFIRSLRMALINDSTQATTAAMYVLQNGKILAASSFKVHKNELIYLNSEPKIYAYNSLKPFLYLSLIENKKDIPPLLLKYQYQNLIFSNKRIEFKANANNNKMLNPNSKKQITNQPLSILSETNINNIPSGLKKSLAEQLDLYEYNLFNVLAINDYYQTLAKFGLVSSHFKTYQDIYNTRATVALFNLVKAYSVFSNEGELREPQYIESINKNIEATTIKKLSIKANYLNLLQDVFLNKVYNKSGAEFFIVFDLNVVIVFNKYYTIAIYLGDETHPNKASDYSEVLANIVPEIINELS